MEIKTAKYIQVELEQVMTDYSASMLDFLNQTALEHDDMISAIDHLAYDLSEFSKNLKALLDPRLRHIRLKDLAREGFTMMMFGNNTNMFEAIEDAHQKNMEIIVQIMDKGEVVCTLNSGDLDY